MKLHHTSINTCLILKILSLVGCMYVVWTLVLIRNVFEKTFLPSWWLLSSLLLRDTVHLKFLTPHIYFHLDSCKLCKQYQSASQEMMGQICNFERAEPQEILIKVCRRGGGGSYYGMRTKLTICLGGSVKYIFLAITYFSSSHIHRRRNKRLRNCCIYALL